MKKDVGNLCFTDKVDNKTAQLFYNMVYNAVSQKGTDVIIKLSADGILIIKELTTRKIA